MKRPFFILALFGALLATLFAFRTTTNNDATTSEEYGIVYGESGAFAPVSLEDLNSALTASTNPVYQTGETIDTIANAANDTLTFAPNLISKWIYNHTVDVTSLSGTVNIIAILQENNERTGGTWYEVERDTLAAAGQIRLHGAYNASKNSQVTGFVKGLRQRLVLDGSGTQSSRYIHNGTYKKE
jgi:hypothetical protein